MRLRGIRTRRVAIAIKSFAMVGSATKSERCRAGCELRRLTLAVIGWPELSELPTTSVGHSEVP
jgi:hypothetical protein